MIHGPFTHPTTVAVKHPHLMVLGASINAHKPIVWHGLIIWFGMHGG
jgi:hypothetical protein